MKSVVGKELDEPVRFGTSAGRLLGRHFPSRVTSTGEKKRPARKCKVCVEKGRRNGKKIRKETVFQCSSCDVGLCIPDCFKIFHTKSEYLYI